MFKLRLPQPPPHYQGPMLVAGGVTYFMLTVLLDRLGMMQTDGLETARYFYNIATGLGGIVLGLTMTALHLKLARRERTRV
jgi:hypothetical protein